MKDVIITIEGKQHFGGPSPEIIEMTVEGKLDFNGDDIVLFYDADSGEGQNISTTLTVKGNGAMPLVTLDREGEDIGRMTIQKGKRHMSLYQMGPCEFSMGIFGENVVCDLGQNGGKLNMKYTIDINSAFAGRNEVDITVKPATI